MGPDRVGYLPERWRVGAYNRWWAAADVESRRMVRGQQGEHWKAQDRVVSTVGKLSES